VESFLAGIPEVKRRPGPERVSIESFAQAYERSVAAGASKPEDADELRRQARSHVRRGGAARRRAEAARHPRRPGHRGPAGRELRPDLCTNLLVYFERGPRALAVANMARALRPGGVLIATDRLVREPGGEVLGLKHIHSELYERFDPQYVYQR
jgi:SAM-dependent methyltransferase